MRTLISGGTIVNENRVFRGSLVIEDSRIAEIIEENMQYPRSNYDEIVDATGCFVIPGVIDDHVHFREPGLTDKADIESESRAAAYGGITSYFEMPNTNPQTTTIEALNEKFAIAKEKSHVNYSFFFGATNDNYSLFRELDTRRIPGIKLFMGSSTGNMLVDKYGSLLKIFEIAKAVNLPIMAHCEDSDTINQNMEQMKKAYGEDPPIALHPLIRSEEACYESSALAVQLARTFGTKLHIAHISTAKELDLLGGNVTGEAVIAHLYFESSDYLTKGALIKCNPAIKTAENRNALQKALKDHRITTIGTDHAPHLLAQKQGGCVKAASGMPMVQFSLVTMLELVDEGALSIEEMVTLMCHNPASLFSVRERGFLRRGYKADIAIVKRENPWAVDENTVQSKCKWSPMMGHEYQWHVVHTFCNGFHLYNDGVFNDGVCGEELCFR
ncbi:MAG: dihydroorotase [Prevotella sp.]|nr:dihydroorotase [Prevotella sp.]